MPKPSHSRSRSLASKIRLEGKKWRVHRTTGEVSQQNESTIEREVDGRQKTVSEGHRRSRDGNYHDGGPFYTARRQPRLNSKPVHLGPYHLTHHDGFMSGDMHLAEYPSLSDYPQPLRDEDLDDLRPYGTTAISRSEPTNSVANLGQALGELQREGLPALHGANTWRRRTSIAKAAGSEYLNHVFGWAPLVDEITKSSETVAQSRDLLNQYQRDEGNNVRRGFSFPIEHSTSQVSYPGNAKIGGISGGYGFVGGGTVTRTVSSVTRRWFSGQFTYALPSHGDSWLRMHEHGQKADKLLGLTLTPDLVWELAPWSWAVDWFSNTGDVIHNLTAFAKPGLAMRYGYIMEHSRTMVSWALDTSGYVNPDGSPVGPPPPHILEIESKVRAPASPFGFSVGWEDLSPTQLAISAALGLTKLR